MRVKKVIKMGKMDLTQKQQKASEEGGSLRKMVSERVAYPVLTPCSFAI